MFFSRFGQRSAMTLVAILSLLASSIALSTPPKHSSVSDVAVRPSPAGVTSSHALDVYKSPSCGCCQEWVEHVEAQGFSAEIHHPSDLNQIKIKYRIAPEYQSCHTAVSSDGYIFEGHIPAKIIQRFLTEKPKDALGLAVPGMPMGSPGMEMGNHFSPYDVLLLKSDGSTQVYIRINSADEQH